MRQDLAQRNKVLPILCRLHTVLLRYPFRRLKRDVQSELPEKVRKAIEDRMSALQAQLYVQMKEFKTLADRKDAKGFLEDDELEAQDRACRTGQTKVVRIRRFITGKSVEATFVPVRYKLDINDKAIQKQETELFHEIDQRESRVAEN
ncbi:hypothetical protein TRAPUB_13838 [Trametes pubescens]|uniref:SNF2 N-terminal domain-containing protein n=1 Tax=Trametes pubescens TaxID=154538 RepID=A0A1M2VQ23_TRAPU|nr:hypothetical protein TRAPUB_13838 [Trametes pubescens]